MSDERIATTPNPAGGTPRRETAGGGEPELVKLRRSMIQQLTASGKLLHAVFSLDRDYFGSRFTGGDQHEGGGDPFQELGLATKIVETLAEELQGSAAFADSPVLRDNMASLVTGVGEVRSAALELERAQLDALHLPQKSEFAARTYPDNNPLACLTEAAGFMRELGNALRRAKDRVNAAMMMLQEAERARQDAEASGGGGGKPDDVAGQLRAELKTRDDEVAHLRNQSRQVQEQAASDLRRLQHHVDQLRQELGREQDLRRGDLAEVRSLAGEIDRLASIDEQLAAREGRGEAQPLSASLAELREALSDPQRSEAIPAAAESVMVEWSRTASARAHAGGAEAARLKASAEALTLTVQQQRDQLGRASETDKHSLELPRLREAVKTLEGDLATARNQAAAAAGEAAKLRGDVARIAELERELARAQELRKSAETAALAARQEKEALATRAAALDGQLADRARIAADELAAARGETAQSRTLVDASLARERQLGGELTRAREANAGAVAQVAEARAALAALGEERDQLQARIDQQRDRTETIARERDRVAGEHQRQLDALNERIAELESTSGERAKLVSRLDELRRTSTVSEEKSRTERDDAARQVAAARDQFSDEQRLHAQTRSERDQLRARLDDLRRSGESQTKQAGEAQAQLARDLAGLREGESRLKGQMAAASAEANRAAARAGELERELAGHREQAAARAREHVQAVEQLRVRESAAREKAEALAAELAQSKGKVSRLENDIASAKRQSARVPIAGGAGGAPGTANAPGATGSTGDAGELALLRQKVDAMQQLLLDARAAVIAAKDRCDELSATDRAIIQGLMDEVASLKRR